jgi:hypothetical protein
MSENISTTLMQWKTDKRIKAAKKKSIKQLIKDGSSHNLAKKLVDEAYDRIKNETI